MKYSLLILVLLSLCNFSYSQTPYKASEGYSWALEQAQSEIGTSAELVAVATASGFDAGIATTEYNPNNGNGTAWLYAFINTDGQTSRVLGVQFPFIGFTNVAGSVQDLSAFEEFLPSTALSTENWIDSDVVGQSLLASSSYQNFAQQYPQAELKYVALGNNEQNSQLPFGEPYWVITFEDDSETTYYICDIQAESGETICFDAFTSVDEDLMQTKIEFNHNNIRLTANHINTQFYIYDIMGKIVSIGEYNTDLLIDIENLPKGKLFIALTNENGQIRKAIDNR